MTKKKKPEVNISELIREVLSTNINATSQEVMDAIIAKHPTLKINKDSFSVGFYTNRKKLGFKSSRQGTKVKRVKRVKNDSADINMSILQKAVVFLKQFNNFEDAIAAVKTVEALQLS